MAPIIEVEMSYQMKGRPGTLYPIKNWNIREKKKKKKVGRQEELFFSNYNSCKIDQNLLDPLDKTKFNQWKNKLNCHVVRSEMNIWIYKCFSFCTAAIVTVVIVKNNFFIA